MILEARLGDTGVDEVIYSFTLPTKLLKTPTLLFEFSGVLWRTSQNTIDAILMQITGGVFSNSAQLEKLVATVASLRPNKLNK